VCLPAKLPPFFLLSKAPRALANTLDHFVDKAGYSEVLEGTKAHAGLYYIPYGPINYKYNAQVQVNDIETEIFFDPR
jgi:hypothetical protein